MKFNNRAAVWFLLAAAFTLTTAILMAAGATVQNAEPVAVAPSGAYEATNCNDPSTNEQVLRVEGDPNNVSTNCNTETPATSGATVAYGGSVTGVSYGNTSGYTYN